MAVTIEKIPITYQQAKFKMFLQLLKGEIEDTNYLYIENSEDTSTITLIRYLGKNASIKVPRRIDGKLVTKIACTCYAYNEKLVAVNIPEGIILID